MNRKEQLLEILANSTGTESYYKHYPVGLYTDGIKLMAETLGAYWLIDAIFSYRRKEDFQMWTLIVRSGRALLTMREDTGAPKKVFQIIKFTDFPEGRWRFYVADGVLMVPREY